jgi:hypothetical protein
MTTDEAVKRALEQDRIIEAGWLKLRDTLPDKAPQAMIFAIRSAYYQGASHMFGFIQTLDKGSILSGCDHERAVCIEAEIRQFFAK